VRAAPFEFARMNTRPWPGGVFDAFVSSASVNDVPLEKLGPGVGSRVVRKVSRHGVGWPELQPHERRSLRVGWSTTCPRVCCPSSASKISRDLAAISFTGW